MGDIKLVVNGQKNVVKEGIRYRELAAKYQSGFEHDIVLAFVDGKLCELNKRAKKDGEVRFLTTAERIGNQAYKRSAIFMMIKAVRDVVGKENFDTVRVMYSFGKGYYCEIAGYKQGINEELLEKVEARMKELVAENVDFEKESLSTDEVIERFKKQGMSDKEKLFKYRRVSRANIYRVKDYEDYFYGYMVPSTGYIKYFRLIPYDAGFVLQLPVAEAPETVPEFSPHEKLFKVLKESDDWGVNLGVDTVGSLNDAIASGDIGNLMLVSEALQERRIGEIATQIVESGKQIILIAGPSSSGKTSFSHRLSIQLRAHGLHPHPIAMDNYFVNREDTPKDEDGKYDFECIGALDVDQFNKDILALLAGKTVELPTFNFQIGQREYRGDILTLGKEDVLVIEGIHGLNPELSKSLPDEKKFRIYISALTQLNVDEHNRIPTTDGRLIRRIVRDARTRGNTAQMTIAMWNSVRRGEEQNIFPYQENADVMFNSALIYELSVIKQYVEPLLFGIPKEAPEYIEAKRLLKFMDYFLGVSSDNIPNNSILREFIGGSCFRV